MFLTVIMLAWFVLSVPRGESSCEISLRLTSRSEFELSHKI